MLDTAALLEFVLRGMAIGALATNAIAFLRSTASRSVRAVGVLFFVSVIAYVINSSATLRAALSAWGAPATFLSLGGGGYFWLFVITLFEDRKVEPWMLAPAALLTIVGIFGLVAVPPTRDAIWIVHNLIEMTFAAHALFVIYRSWRGDLVEARRRVRGPFMAVVTMYTIALSGIEIGESLGVQASWYSLAGAAALAFFCLAGCFMFLESRATLFGAAEPAAKTATGPQLDAADRLTLERLAQIVDKGEAWRREGVTIGTLAEEVGTPEHRLRRLINDHLGHRNFAAFVNVRRIEAAKRILSDAAQARTTVAAIAFELGFGSLGPFNRAFKEATGQTPTQWRREALEKASPNSEIAG